ncbi:AraC family transcriptional regulator [Dyadobacter luteus]|jgi:AraC family transcriptional activator of pobA|uniref:AraC family transcriptional regulator n=1 Tax=Dyadobacter luteus TaxID=2259619 RepID=A0A3D8YG68_9BACT|nr:helix-turn-helix domain-containing protein [Dyadobacter luteus]REA63651.1 AraC family transcriptional regulator [Dyadobacter luteus]
MISNTPHRITTISKYHRVMGLPGPQHPLISVIDYNTILSPCQEHVSFVFDFYAILLDRDFKGKMKYGQQQSDFDKGVLFLMSPGQIFQIDAKETTDRSGWLLLVHPDLLWHTHLAKDIKQYGFFDYAINEALFLSEREEAAIIRLLENIKNEYQHTIDKFSQPAIVAQLELLLTYCDRYYQRQFITRQKSNHQILARLEVLLTEYFSGDDLLGKGLPTVQKVADQLNLSPKYLSNLLRVLTGQNTQQHIHNKLIEKAKQKLSTTDLTISEIAYDLGFEHPPSFSKLFKAKTRLSPIEFRRSFN